MEASLRPWYTTGVALVGASAIALAPIAPITSSAPAMDMRAAAAAVSRDFQLAALDIPYILTLPIVRQQIANWAQNWAVYLAGLAKAGVGAVDSLLAIPGVTVEIVQEVLALNFVGAFDTFATAARDAVIAVGQPLLDSVIWRNQKALVVQAALAAAMPQAFIDVVNGFLVAGNGVTTALIVGTQDFVGALLTLNLSNIINAAVDGTKNFIVALGAGAGAIVSGIESAQLGIATALATSPPPPPFSTAADVAGLDTLAASSTYTLARSSAATIDPVAPTQDPPVTTTPDATVPVDGAASGTPVPTAEEQTTGAADGKNLDAPPTTGATPASGITHDPTDPVDPPKKPVDTTPVKDVPKDLDQTVTKVTDGVEKSTPQKTDPPAKDDAGSSPAKPASNADGE